MRFLGFFFFFNLWFCGVFDVWCVDFSGNPEIFQEITSAGGKTVWGDPAEVGKVVAGAAFDVVLDNNGKDFDSVRFVCSNFLNWAV